ncbi:tetratricopeptide repeat protein [Vibrio sp. RC27]
MKRMVSLITFMCVFSSMHLYASVEIGLYRTLYKNHDFIQLEQLQNQANEQFIEGKIDSHLFKTAFYQTYYKRDLKEDWLKETISLLEASGSHSAYRLLNLGIYYADLASQARGNKWISSVSASDLKQMNDMYNISNQYLNLALEKDPSLLIAYQELIGIAMNYSGEESKQFIEATFQQALKYKKDNLTLAGRVLRSRTPRWGGSYEIMEKTIDNLRPNFRLNMTDFAHLDGYIIYDKLYVPLTEYSSEDALLALAPYKDHPSYLIQNSFAGIYHYNGQWEQCYHHAKLAAKEARYDLIQATLGKCALELGRWDEALEPLVNYLNVAGPSAWTLHSLADVYRNLGHPEIAYPLFKEAISLDFEYMLYSMKPLLQIKSEFPDKTDMNLEDAYHEIGYSGD